MVELLLSLTSRLISLGSTSYRLPLEGSSKFEFVSANVTIEASVSEPEF